MTTREVVNTLVAILSLGFFGLLFYLKVFYPPCHDWFWLPICLPLILVIAALEDLVTKGKS